MSNKSPDTHIFFTVEDYFTYLKNLPKSHKNGTHLWIELTPEAYKKMREAQLSADNKKLHKVLTDTRVQHLEAILYTCPFTPDTFHITISNLIKEYLSKKESFINSIISQYTPPHKHTKDKKV